MMRHNDLSKKEKRKESFFTVLLFLILPLIIPIAIAKLVFLINPVIQKSNYYLFCTICYYLIIIALNVWVYRTNIGFNEYRKKAALVTMILSLSSLFGILSILMGWERNHAELYIDNGCDTTKQFIVKYIKNELELINIDTIIVRKNDYERIEQLPCAKFYICYDSVKNLIQLKPQKKFLFNPYAKNSYVKYYEQYAQITYLGNDRQLWQRSINYDSLFFFEFDADIILNPPPPSISSKYSQEEISILSRKEGDNR